MTQVDGNSEFRVIVRPLSRPSRYPRLGYNRRIGHVHGHVSLCTIVGNHGQVLKTRPWQIAVEGEIKRPKVYDIVLPNQNGAPVRVVVPWKYGFKSAKSIVSIRFVETQPIAAWNRAGPREYGFYSNVNPERHAEAPVHQLQRCRVPAVDTAGGDVDQQHGQASRCAALAALHRLIYPIALFGVMHYWWLVKRDVTQPLIYAMFLAVLLGFRLIYRFLENRGEMTASRPMVHQT